MDVLEFTGTDNAYYSDPRLQGLFEWLTRGAVTPAKKLVVFGDTYNNFNFTKGVGNFKMSRFSPQAARNMAWLLEGSPAPSGAIQRVSGANVTGATVDLGSDIVDTALESAGQAILTNGPVSWQGLAALYRFTGTAQQFFLVRQGVFFSDGASPRRGFSAENTVSLHLRNNHGWIISPGTNVTFNSPNISAVQLNSTAVPVLASGPHWVRVHVPAGSHKVHLLSGTQPGTPSPPRQLRLRVVE